MPFEPSSNKLAAKAENKMGNNIRLLKCLEMTVDVC